MIKLIYECNKNYKYWMIRLIHECNKNYKYWMIKWSNQFANANQSTFKVKIKYWMIKLIHECNKTVFINAIKIVWTIKIANIKKIKWLN